MANLVMDTRASVNQKEAAKGNCLGPEELWGELCQTSPSPSERRLLCQN